MKKKNRGELGVGGKEGERLAGWGKEGGGECTKHLS